MNTYEVMIVDDSPFTVTVIKEILERHGHEVVGSAGTLDEVKEMVMDTMPELVTMDMTLPGTDGFECTRAIHAYNPTIKIIAISSMKDDDIVSEAIRHNISAYIQKPINEEELIAAVNATMASGDLFETIEDEFFGIFKEALNDGVKNLTKTALTYKEEEQPDDKFTSEGITCMINVIGKFSGRMMISLSKACATGLAVATLKRELQSDMELSNFMMELANVVSGNAISVLNTIISKRNRSYGLRLSPPSVFEGKDVQVFPPEYKTQTIVAESTFGKILLNVGFKRGE
ncbi:MAG: response regulator [Defluviitaleaceae bacterium]|nr:response regulator [Defluviitaleaceae bacterium]MCL2274870.1 response regulator [Defluviitaleaceae bacterium]